MIFTDSPGALVHNTRVQVEQICNKANFAKISSLDLSDKDKKEFTAQRNGQSRFFRYLKMADTP